MPPVVFVLIDGLRPDAIGPQMPNLQALLQRSSYTLRARSVMPSITLPCHTSIFHSVPPERHGITTNDWTPMARPLPGLFDLAKQNNLRSGLFANWEYLRDMARPGSVYTSFFCDSAYDADGDQIVAEQALRMIGPANLDFAFVYFGCVDSAGHMYGWMSEGYLAQTAQADTALGTLLAGLPADSNILLQSDHGGHDRNHGTDSPEDMTIPWLVSGPKIRPSYQITRQVSLLDTAPTLARLLRIMRHREWEGQIVDEIFV